MSDIANKKKIIDPPGGWKYGFPKEIPSDVVTSEEFKEWLVASGYPERDIELALKYSRYWEEPP